MRKTIIIVGIVMFGCLISIPALAHENKDTPVSVEHFVPMSSEEVDAYFRDLNDSDKILQLPDGGFLHGSATIEYEDGRTITLNSETDSNAISVEEVKKLLK